jgi:hypothetical protein
MQCIAYDFQSKASSKNYVGLVSRRRQGLAKFQRDIFENL